MPPRTDALGHPTRRGILTLLAAGEKNAGEIAEALDQRRPTISHHLAVLLDAGLVTCRSQGSLRIYVLSAGRVLEAWDAWIDEASPSSPPRGQGRFTS